MEVHSHVHTERKKWHHYFWEFFMLFLAVTLGFFVENQRERWLEKNHAKQYIQSLIEDMQADSSMLIGRAMGVTTSRINRADSLWRWMSSAERNSRINQIYFETAETFRHGKYKFHDRTIVQLKNAGGMRLIENEQVADTIYAYYKEVGAIEGFDEAIHNYIDKLIDLTSELFYTSDWAKANTVPSLDSLRNEKFKFLSTDQTLINKYCTYMFMYKSRESGLKNTAMELYDRAGKMIRFIKKEYHLK
jgi:hypothetical protein